jgi:hypothetical protein
MCIALIGGMDRLERCYVMEAERVGISLKVFNGQGARLTSRMGKKWHAMPDEVGHCWREIISLP